MYVWFARYFQDDSSLMEDKEEDVSSYWMTLRKREDNGN
jgi:hypothetical protein